MHQISLPTSNKHLPKLNHVHRTVSYTGSFKPSSGTAYLSLYGWTTNPLIEYRIVESYMSDPSTDNCLAYKGNLTSDGGTYNIYRCQRPDESLFPENAVKQFWSVRTEKRVGGTITTANHFDAWKAVGMELSTFNYQLLATEGEKGSGSSSITIL
jgi:endo-1,4-beta-xylanase